MRRLLTAVDPMTPFSVYSVAEIDGLCFPDAPRSPQEYLAALRKGDVYGLVAKRLSDDRPAGFALYSREQRYAVRLLRLGVHPDFRGRGVGRGLVETLAASLAYRPGRLLLLTADLTESQLRLGTFFKRCGFECNHLIGRKGAPVKAFRLTRYAGGAVFECRP